MSGTLLDRLSGKLVVHLDTNIFIYFIQQNSTYLGLMAPVFNLIESGRLRAQSSTISLIEVLVHPFRANRMDLVHEYRNILTRSPHLTIFPVDNVTAELGASLRARMGCKTPDAIQIATAITRHADVFLTNDRGIRSVDDLDVVVLEDFVRA